MILLITTYLGNTIFFSLKIEQSNDKSLQKNFMKIVFNKFVFIPKFP